jgi:hypothetical protein
MTIWMCWAALLMAVLVGPAEPRARQQAPADLDGLAWLAGSWVAERDGRWTEEHWIAPRGGVMLGVNRSGGPTGAARFEFLRPEADGTAVTYWAMPGGRTAVGFRLTSLVDQHAVFENPAHDYPTRIEYKRDGDHLDATVSGPEGTRVMTWRWSLRR